MGLPASPIRVSEPETNAEIVRFVGGSAAVTKTFGSAITTSYVSTGIVDLVFSENPGTYLGSLVTFEATAASGVKGYTAVITPFNSTTLKLRCTIYDAGGTPTLVDLAAAQWLTVLALFRRGGVTG